MFEYRNVYTGRVLARPQEDKWLEASPGWERIDAPNPTLASGSDQDEGSND